MVGKNKSNTAPNHVVHDHYTLETTIMMRKGDYHVDHKAGSSETHTETTVGGAHTTAHHEPKKSHIFTKTGINKITELHILKNHKKKTHHEKPHHFQYDFKLEIYADEKHDDHNTTTTTTSTHPPSGHRVPVYVSHLVFRDSASLLAHLKLFETHSPDIIAISHDKKPHLLPVRIYCSHVYEKRHDDKLYMNFYIGIKSRDQNIHTLDHPVDVHEHGASHTHTTDPHKKAGENHTDHKTGAGTPEQREGVHGGEKKRRHSNAGITAVVNQSGTDTPPTSTVFNQVPPSR